MNLAQSMTEPPATARIRFIPCSRTRFTPSRTLSSRGFGVTPESSTTSLPASRSAAVTSS